MSAKCFALGRHIGPPAKRAKARRAFTLIEILVVVTIIGILVAALGVVLANTGRKAREAATITVIQKIDGLLQDRIKGFERYTKSRNFQQLVDYQKTQWDLTNTALLPPPQFPKVSVSRKFAEAATRKDWFRISFPQSFTDPVDLTGTTAIAKILADPTTPTYNLGNHKPETESAAVLYYVISRMQVFGVAPVGESEFSTREVADTDNDGLLEFVDGWGRPLRFYRWPTRLFKPNGIVGADGMPGVAGVNDYDPPGTAPATDDPQELGWIGSDDVIVGSVPSQPGDIRSAAGLLIDGLPRVPVIAGQWDTLSEDPDDPYGLVSTEIKRVLLDFPTINLMRSAPAKRYIEAMYPTLDTFHMPLIVSVGPDNDLGLFEPYFTEDINGNGLLDSGEDTNANGILDIGILAQPRGITVSGSPPQFVIPTSVISALSDNLTNRNRRAGKGK